MLSALGTGAQTPILPPGKCFWAAETLSESPLSAAEGYLWVALQDLEHSPTAEVVWEAREVVGVTWLKNNSILWLMQEYNKNIIQ